MNQRTAEKLLKKVVEDYERIAGEFDQTRQHSWTEFENFLEYINHKDRIADIGCGNGRFYKFVREHRNIDYHGIDNSKKLLEHAQKNHPEAKFTHGDLLDIPIKDESKDVAITIAALHHIPSKKLRKKAIQELKRILKKNGTLIVSAWNLFQPKYKKHIWKSRLKHILSLGKYDPRDTFIAWGDSGVKRYYYAFKQKELEKLLKEVGFKVMHQEIENNIIFICKKS